MIGIILKFKKIILSLLVIVLSIFLYSNKPYSIYEINYIKKVSQNKIENSKLFYLKKLDLKNLEQDLKILTVKKNQNLSSILKKENLSTPKIFLKKSKKNCFYRINVNDKIIIKNNRDDFEIERNNKFIRCIYRSNDNSIVKIDKKSKNNDENKHTELFVFFNEIKGSFYNAAINSGLTPNEIMSLADIFGWDIDFSLDIRKGDSFGVVVKRHFLYSKHYKSTITYALFKNNKNFYNAYRYKGKYYDSNGESLQKQFLKAPLNFARISSHFNKRRLHPIFKTTRPHLGTDYAAPTGTPVYSTGDGTVIYKGRKGGYGKTVIIKHGNIYTTLYAHFSKYKKGLYVGKKVKQKEVIGYVGSTGYSTGPHVHYEFRVRGVHKNSVKIKFKKDKKLNKNTVIKMKNTHKKNINIYSWLNKNYIKLYNE